MIGTVLLTIGGHAFVVSIPGTPGDAAASPAVAATSFVPGLWYYSLGFAIFLGVLWFVSENKRFKGPPMGAEIAKRQASIAAQEKALAGK